MFKTTSEAEGRLWVKICGITNLVDALAAIDYGADALGFNLVRSSKRYIDTNSAAEWIVKLPANAAKVAILADPSLEEAIQIAELPFIDVLQLHGSESPAFCQRLAERGISFAKAIPAGDETFRQDLSSFGTSTIVLDSISEGKFGGTGQTFSWKRARELVRANRRLNLVLAGGLTPENVASAVAEVRPFGVDVTSGVESSSGQKDHERMRVFIKAAVRARG
jgi:phosphoribosylanthranilate isomerase